jgi:1,2-diacylglycerol 3-alpha-glucosyltransferase
MSATYALFSLNHGPYHLARIGALANILPNVIAVEIASKESKYLWCPDKRGLHFQHVTLFDRTYESLGSKELRAIATEFLETIQPSLVMVLGYADSVMRHVAVWARRRGVPCVMYTETHYRDRKRYWWKETVKAIYCRRYFSAMFLTGERSVAYFTGLGFPEERIWRGVGVVDNDFFENLSSVARRRDDEERRALDLPDRYFITVARLSTEKNILGLLTAYSEYRQQGGDWSLVLVGAGPQEQELKAFREAQGIPEVHFVGWKQYHEVPAYYGLASCFVMPSTREPWGFVVNEAMACGLPVLVSRQCGCQPELCHRGINGYDFSPWDEGELTRLMLWMSSGQVDLEAMGKASCRIIANHTLETWALSAKDCFLTTLESSTKSGY